MCGIYGSTIKYSDEVICEKLARVDFRGPDFSGFKQLDGLTLGHNRLSIIDLDPRSNQPFGYLHLQIVFNGEIYNYLEVRKELKQQGYQFRTGSDTEVICVAYLAYGANCVQHFNGMFAFVIYDSVKKELFGARDRLGKKPFYYSHSGQSFEFASQPGQLSIGRKLTIDETAIHEYLVWNNIPEPRSIYLEVKKLPAGHRFTFDLFSGKLNISKYWDLDYNCENKFTGSYQTAREELSSLLTDAVKIRMFADVPLGVFLSGGIDSSLITALAVQQVENVKTFSVKFNENGFDESVYAEKVAKHLGTHHHTITCDYHEGIDLIENLSRYYDEPFADASAIPSLLLSKHTRKHVTVALSGDAGDEAFLGYHRYKWINNVQLLFGLPLPVRKAIASLVALSPKYRHKLIAMGISMPTITALYVKIFGGMENSWVLNNDTDLANEMMYILNNRLKPLLERVSDFDIKTYLNGDINTKVDRASMAFSLESRSPLMDYRIIEFSRTLPTDFKFYKGNQKRILKDLLFEHVPAHFFDRPKAGFTMPFQHWFRKELKTYVQDNLSERELHNIPGINIPRTREIIEEHLSGRWNRYPQIWKLLVLAQWLKGQKKTAQTPSGILG
ncbi:asparagine synthase (glutamine-hydrolyzing) [Pedobacter africanus]|uniref:Asparagine synthase (Glutamine-hydrolyzing) n=1 Tax=Pedobacter africanus TaxID=151894 RepID=A0ACC6KT77_9SPHI|nr:asparagine synthase (glutamine-hydrolyzing) [Pedobacter africanus]MDR6782405.1 asparagine synthase (glutamine-hydrolyzing) [Pedobacter africanus]